MGLYETLESDANLILRYKFESNLMDSSSTGFSPTTLGTASYAAGKFGNGVVFDPDGTAGLSDFEIPHASLSIADDFTIACWCRQDETGTTPLNFAGVFCKDGTEGTLPVEWGITYASANSLRLRRAGTSLHQETVDTSIFHHAVITFDEVPTPTVKFYVDGDLKYTGTGTSVNLATASDLHFGTNKEANRILGGMLDDIFVFDRVLSDAEVSGLYAGPSTVTSGLTVVEPLIEPITVPLVESLVAT